MGPKERQSSPGELIEQQDKSHERARLLAPGLCERTGLCLKNERSEFFLDESVHSRHVIPLSWYHNVGIFFY